VFRPISSNAWNRAFDCQVAASITCNAKIKIIVRLSEYGLQARQSGPDHTRGMERREFIALVGAAMAWPIAAFAQDSTRVHRIFWLSTQSQPDPFLDGFREGLRARGYVEGKNLVLELHYAIGNPQALREVAAELRRGKVDLAVSSGPATRAMTEVAEVPVLFALSGDPVALGLVRSLGQPGGNFTGSTFLSLELAGKRVELLKEVLPNLRKLAVLSNANHPGEQSEWRATKEAAQKLDIVPHYVPFSGANELDSALGLVGEAHADALLVFPDVLTMVHRTRIAEFAVPQRLPSMFGWSEYCDAGGLLSYGANQRATYFWLATYADRILRGEKPANLPVHQPTKFELVVNLRTAELLGVDLDKSSVMFRANRVIE
jgi:putative tryptophan/tyrosine transport system substrate-binding protein